MASSRFNVVIVGGGVAGLVAASRLSEDNKTKVLVVEAGPDLRGDQNIDTPGLLLNTWGNPYYDWDFWSVPQSCLNGREIPQSRGKVLGGSSAINATALLFPASRDFETWTSLGNKGWTAKEMMPYYRKFMTYHGPSENTNQMMSLGSYMQPDLYGQHGPIQGSFAEFGELDAALLQAFESTQSDHKSDPILGKCRGMFTPLSSVDPKTRKRSYAASAYMTNEIEGRENLHLLVDTLVDKIILHESENGLVQASGIKLHFKDGRDEVIYCDEVILAAGSLQTPLVLERSGIGAAKILNKNNIPVVINNPGVGENLQDHMFAPISYEVADGVETRDAVRDPNIVKALVNEYLENRSGALASVPLNYGFLPPVDNNGLMGESSLKLLVDEYFQLQEDADGVVAAGRNAQWTLIKSLLLDPNESACYFGMFPGQQNINPEGRTTMQDMHAPLHPENFVSISVGLNHPLSRGSIHIANPNVEAPPIVDPAYLSHPLDLELLSRGLQFVDNQLIHQEGMKNVVRANGRRLPSYATHVSELATAKRIARERLWTNYHPACSCPMLPRELGGVVDDRLVVYGTNNVRIIDASVFPVITQGNIQATVYAVAERACDLMKEDNSCRM